MSTLAAMGQNMAWTPQAVIDIYSQDDSLDRIWAESLILTFFTQKGYFKAKSVKKGTGTLRVAEVISTYSSDRCRLMLVPSLPFRASGITN